MSNCTFEKLPDGRWSCPVCGFQTKQVFDTAPRRNCTKRGLGDVVADCLKAVGVTKRRVSRLFRRRCGCGERQSTLNKLGAKVSQLFSGSGKPG